MSDENPSPPPIVRSLIRGAITWIERGQATGLGHWLDRELDAEGIPRRLPVTWWGCCLSALADARRSTRAWPEAFDARIEGFFRQTLRFSRPGGAPVFGPLDAWDEARSLYRYWADQLSDPALVTVVDWWFPVRTRRHAPPPLPAVAQEGAALAILRANWSKEGDFLAIDQRDRGGRAAFELFGNGRRWLGPWWDSGPESPAPPARMTRWVSQSSGDLAEWTFRSGPTQVVRSALLLRGRRLALLGQQVDGAGAAETMRVAIPEGTWAEPVAGNRGIALAAHAGRPSARVFPLGLPCADYPTDRGAFSCEASALVLRQIGDGARRWLPLLVSWDPLRNRKSVTWRTLTVTEKGEICPPGRAFAARVTWGRDETLLIYRSLTPAAPRVVLGHQTRARFLVALFTTKGVVEPIFTVEE